MLKSPRDGTETGQLCKQVCSDYKVTVLGHGRHASTIMWLCWQMARVGTDVTLCGGIGSQQTCEEAVHVPVCSYGSNESWHSCARAFPGCHMAVLVHDRYSNRHAHPAFLAVLGTVYVQVCGPKMPHDGPGLWQTFKHVFLHCLVLVLEHIRHVNRCV